jgi:endonuclease YncB( thermonuclease family)
MARVLVAALLAAVVCAGGACAEDAVPAVPAPGAATGGPSPVAPPPAATSASTDLGAFRLAADAVVDADTLRLESPRESVRVHGIDAEEVFHDERERREAEADFAAYAARKRGSGSFPVKFPTPAGEAAKAWAARFLEGVKVVRLESDEPGRDRDGYGRRLAHVFVPRGAGEVLFAEEVVRAGWSPYFVKYGRSLRYDARLTAAQEEARARRRGIWGDAVHHYPDYAERLAWWDSRAKQVDAWDRETREQPGRLDRIRLGVPAETARLASLVGKSVTLFASVDREDLEGDAPRVLLIDRPRKPFAVVVPDRAVWDALDHRGLLSRFVRVTGVLEERRGRHFVTLRSASDLSTR